jgi:hypothetical protein
VNLIFRTFGYFLLYSWQETQNRRERVSSSSYSSYSLVVLGLSDSEKHELREFEKKGAEKDD